MKRAAKVLLVLALLAAGPAWYVYDRTRPTELRGSAGVEFEAREERAQVFERTPWPMYGFDARRRQVARGFAHRPPFKRMWRLRVQDNIEFPPAIGYGRVFVAQQRGPFVVVHARNGRLRWKRDFGRCAASSPALDPHRRIVYQAFMHPYPCAQGGPGDGIVVSLRALEGIERWRFRAGGPVESSLLLVRGRLYFGSWDGHVYALHARTGRKLWSRDTGSKVNTSAAYARGTVYIANDAGQLLALDARTGAERWRAEAGAGLRGREFFYATPAVAYGRVYIGNTDGTMYAYGARTGRMLWARPIGSYVYGAAAAWRRTIYVGTYDGGMYALDAATGDVRWRREAQAAVHAAPTVMDGLVYFATCSTCGGAAKRAVRRGPNGTVGLDARTGRTVWRFREGKYAAPMLADRRRAYLVGRTRVYAFRPRR